MSIEEAEAMSSSFSINLSYKGTNATLDKITTAITCEQLRKRVLRAFNLSENDITELKLLYKGKKLDLTSTSAADNAPVFDSKPPAKASVVKMIVMATSKSLANDIATKRSDPTIRGFRQEEERRKQRRKKQEQHYMYWGKDNSTQQHKEYKFCHLESCSWQSFGTRPDENKTPHDFEATSLLHKLATDPGIVAIMVERELVVHTLGEMDPIDDRIMLKKQQGNQGGGGGGVCLLGYNTNHGLRIDVKLRTDDLKGFRPYPQLVLTLIHELSHNWVGEHNLLFWANYAQMRIEYLYAHARMRSTLVNGKTTAELAGLTSSGRGGLEYEHIYDRIMKELVKEMAQHRLHPNMIAEPIRQRIQELMEEDQRQATGGGGRRLGGGGGTTGGEVTKEDEAASSSNSSGATDNGGVGVGDNTTSSSSSSLLTPRERAVAAAEARRRRNHNQQQRNHNNHHRQME